MARIRSWVAVGAFVLAAAGFTQTSAGSAVLRDTGVSGQPSAYTALSFANPNDLPTQLYSLEALLPADFVIRNESSDARQYDWQVVEVKEGRDRLVASGRAAVAPGAATTITRSFVASCAGRKIGISVRLTAPREAIEFWSSCATASGLAP
jgi:hypothetical protein